MFLVHLNSIFDSILVFTYLCNPWRFFHIRLDQVQRSFAQSDS